MLHSAKSLGQKCTINLTAYIWSHFALKLEGLMNNGWVHFFEP